MRPGIPVSQRARAHDSSVWLQAQKAGRKAVFACGLVGFLLFSGLGSVTNGSLLLAQEPGSEAAPKHQGSQLQIDAKASQVRFSLGATLHTIEGTAKVERSALWLDPTEGTLTGEIVVDARSLETGNAGRDRKMHTEVLHSAEFQRIVFRPQRIEGRLEAGKVQIRGRLEILGAEHELLVETSVARDGEADVWSGEARFTVPYVAWGLEDVSTFVLRVEKQVEVSVSWRAAAPPSSAGSGRDGGG